jgi:tetratricopeptide (TPR) repeat protein
LKEAIELDPRSRVAHLFAAKAYIEQGLFEEGLREAQISHDLFPTNSSGLANAAYGYALAGRPSEAIRILDALLELAAKQYVPAFNIAMIYNALAQTGDAITWLERGMEQRAPYMTFLASDPKWKNLRDEPRYLALLRRLNLPTAWPQGS